jgi:hypothetical protein
MNELDLTGINPLRWEDARLRARIVQNYLQLSKPTELDRERCLRNCASQ